MRRTAIIAFICLIALSASTWPASQGNAAPSPPGSSIAPSPIPTPPSDGLKRWGYYVQYDKSSWESLQGQIGALDIVSPHYYTIDGTGEIKGKDEERVTRFVKSAGVAVVPMIQNTAQYGDFSPVLQDPGLRRQVVDALVKMVNDYDYDGIHIDFEALNAEDRPFLTRFMAELAQQLRPRGKLVTMALGAKEREMTTGWAGPYDYAGLAPYLDYAVIMAYDYATGTDRPGSTSPIWWVRKVADFAASQIPPNKLLLGLALWAYDWDATGQGGASSRRYPDVVGLMHEFPTTSGYSEDDQSAWLRYTRDGRERVVWYENRRSVETKMGVAAQRKLAGVAVWRLGHEDPDMWSAFRAYAPSLPSAASAPGHSAYFAITDRTVRGDFLQYFSTHGGLDIFGYPRTEEIVENGLTVQYFQRARMERHPENPPAWRILLGLLGDEVGVKSAPTAPPSAPRPNLMFVPETGHTVGNAFLSYFVKNGGPDIFGYPRTEEITERGLTVQYFQRARMEWHPDNPGPWQVQLGLLGDELLRRRGALQEK